MGPLSGAGLDAAAPVAAPLPGAAQFVDGVWLASGGAGAETIFDPSTGEPVGTVPHAETGCPVTPARGQQVGLPIRHLEYWAEAARRPELSPRAPVLSTRTDGSSTPGNWVVRHEPYGVVAEITPYNFPLLENVMKIGPALAAGNTVVLKPSPFTPYSALLLAEAAQRADADLDLAVRIGAQNICTHAGQGCALLTRHLVHRSVHDEYCSRIGSLLARAVVGDPRDPVTTVGPLIRPAARDRVESYVADALSGGASVVSGAARPALPDALDGGWFYLPTMLAHVRNTWPVAREEIFGPVGVVIGFDTDEEAVATANDSPYGLAGHVVSADTGRAFEIACRLRTGSVDLNGGPGYTNPDVPFGGVERSGLGRENGAEGFGEYVQTKTIKYGAR